MAGLSSLLLTLLLAFSVAQAATETPATTEGQPGLPPSSAGPAYPEQAKILWETGKSAFDTGKCDEAAPALRRLIDRYPGYEGHLAAHLFLGKCLLDLKDYRGAIEVLKGYIASSKTHNDSLQARLWLGRAQLEAKAYSEAYLTALEIQTFESQGIPVPADFVASSLVLKGWALLGLKHSDRASKALDAAKKNLKALQSASAKGEIPRLELKIKLMGCERFPVKGKLDESQFRSQLDRRGTCLMEALVLFRQILESSDPTAAQLGSQELAQGFKGYSQRCVSPPAPPGIQPDPRNKLQSRRYRTELIDLLQKDCNKIYGSAQELLKEWKDSTPASTAPELESLKLELQKVQMKNT